MEFSSEVLSVCSAVVSSIFTTGIAYGMMKTKVDRVVEDVREINAREALCEEKFVTHNLFNATVAPIRDGLNEMRGDIKKILVCLNKNYGVPRHADEYEE